MIDRPERRLVEFARVLRAAGVAVGTDRLALLARAAPLAPDDLYWAGAATLVSRPDDLALYHRLFEAHFGEAPPPAPARTSARSMQAVPIEATTGGMTITGEPPEMALASAAETLRRKSFARCSADELAELARLMARLELRAPRRRTRRRMPARRGEPDLRRTLRRAFRTSGEPMVQARRRRRQRRRRLVFVVDVSGSMAAYSRGLLLFAHAALRADASWEAFAFGTRLTRLTDSFAESAPDLALASAGRRDTDWDGGTRIGAIMADLLAGFEGTVRGAIVVILSDGLDVGEPELLGEQMRRLARLAHRVVWLNPLKENPEYAPLARGMRAALPSIDVFASGHDLHSLERVAATIAEL